MKRKLLIITFLRLLIIGASLYFVFHYVPFAEVFSELKNVNIIGVLSAVGITVVSLLVRGYRYALLVNRKSPKFFFPAFSVTSIGLGMNATMPGKAGEVARVALTKQLFGIAISESAVAAILERVLDGLCLVIAFLVISVLALDQGSPLAEWWRDQSGIIHSILLFSMAVVLTLFVFSFRSKKNNSSVNEDIGEPGSERSKVFHLISGIMTGIQDLSARLMSLPTLFPLICFTFLIWLLQGLALYVLGSGIDGFSVSITESFIILIVTTFAAAIPSSPGAWGVYEMAGLLVGEMIFLGATESVISTYIILSHVIQYFPIVVIYLIIAVINPMQKNTGD